MAEFLGPIIQKLWIITGLQNYVQPYNYKKRKTRKDTPIPRVHFRVISPAHSKFSINPAGWDG